MKQNLKIALAIILLWSFSAVVVYADDNGKVNVNTATYEELQFLPRIGPSTADNILYAREQGFRFEKPSDLEAVHRIGPKTVEKLTPYIVFEGETTAKGKLGSTAKSAGSKFKRPETNG